ncbi:hypothetical protein DPMN_040326 [Dreissena polymorpha]|uniref:Uncharacterized protein n=1 Tax=Dreissena polymorpha TaxID=45954 RepID=A0A9D4CWP2_DREPO|nr:hypothetical protein DPMN_040326 [Dreissena polymorpha]
MPRPSWYLQETPRRRQTVSQTVGAPAGDSQTVCDSGKTVWAPVGDSHTVPDNIPDRRGTRRKLPDSLRRCQDSQGTCRRLPDGARNSPRPSGHLQETLCDDAKTVWALAGDSQTVSQNVWAPTIDSQTVCDGAKTTQAHSGDTQMVSDSLPDRRGTCRRLTDSLRRCTDRLSTCRRFQNSLRRSERLSGTVIDCLGIS